MAAIPLFGYAPSDAVRRGVLAPPGVTAGPSNGGALTDSAGGVKPPPGGWFPDTYRPPAIPPAAAAPLGIFAAAFLAGALANLAIRGLLHLLNRNGPAPLMGNFNDTNGIFATARSLVFTTLGTLERNQYYCNNGNAVPSNGSSPLGPYSNNLGSVRSYYFTTATANVDHACGGGGIAQANVTCHYTNAAGVIQTPWVRSHSLTYGSTVEGNIKISVDVVGVTLGGVIQPTPFTFPPDPLPQEPLPDIQPLEEPLAPPLINPRKAPAIAPPTERPGPGQDPLAPPAPGPGSTPAPYAPGTGTGFGSDPNRQLVPLILPIRVPSPAPFDPAAPQVGNGTVTVQPLPPTVPQTDPGTEVTPDGVIGQPGTAPPATMEGIAAEVGRIEQKTRQLLDRPGVTLQDLMDLLPPPDESYPSGSYQIAGPCELAVNGSAPPPRVATWPAGNGALALVDAKLNALALLLQHHKNIRQPICATKASGQPVTVQFQEIG